MLRSKFAFSVGLAIAGVSSSAMAEFTISELQEASKVALTAFETDNPDHVDHFVGYKSWKSGEDAKVKVYVMHDKMKMEFDYDCHKHDKDIECHAK